jgi:hypothetical protein
MLALISLCSAVSSYNICVNILIVVDCHILDFGVFPDQLSVVTQLRPRYSMPIHSALILMDLVGEILLVACFDLCFELASGIGLHVRSKGGQNISAQTRGRGGVCPKGLKNLLLYLKGGGST